MRVRACSAACATPATCQRCADEHPEGASLAAQAAYCTATSCMNECAASPWACVGSVTWAESATTTFDLDLWFTDYATTAPLRGLSVRSCSLRDPSCTNFLGQAVSDADGKATVTVKLLGPPNAYRGFLEVVGGSGGFDYRALVFFAPPLVGPGRYYPALASTATVRQISDQLRIPSDASRSTAVFAARDCLGAPARGLRVGLESAGPDARVFYTRDTIPVLGLTETGGLPGSQNVVIDPGAVSSFDVVATVEGVRGEVARLGVLVRPGFVTYSDLVPTPAR
jgi:hypothetical protein